MRLSDDESLHPEEKTYSVVKLDTWKAPTDDDFAYKVGEIDSVDADPMTTAGQGEEILIVDGDGNVVSETKGPKDPLDATTREDR